MPRDIPLEIPRAACPTARPALMVVLAVSSSGVIFGRLSGHDVRRHAEANVGMKFFFEDTMPKSKIAIGISNLSNSSILANPNPSKVDKVYIAICFCEKRVKALFK